MYILFMCQWISFKIGTIIVAYIWGWNSCRYSDRPLLSYAVVCPAYWGDENEGIEPPDRDSFSK